MNENEFYNSFIESVIDTLQEDIDQLSIIDQVIILERGNKRLDEIITPLRSLSALEEKIEYFKDKLFNTLKIPATSL